MNKNLFEWQHKNKITRSFNRVDEVQPCADLLLIAHFLTTVLFEDPLKDTYLTANDSFQWPLDIIVQREDRPTRRNKIVEIVKKERKLMMQCTRALPQIFHG